MQLLQPADVSFNPQTGYLVLVLDPDGYGYRAEPVRYQERIFAPKQELHITVIGRPGATVLLEFLSQHPERLPAVQELVEQTDWRFGKRRELYHVQKEPGVETIIQMVELPALEAFFQAVNGLLGQELPLPPAHVTQYMRGTETGIGLPTQAAFAAQARAQVTPEALQSVEGAA